MRIFVERPENVYEKQQCFAQSLWCVRRRRRPPRVLLDLSTGYMRHTSGRTDRPKFVHIHAITHSSSLSHIHRFWHNNKTEEQQLHKKIDISRWVGPPHSRQLAHKQHSARTNQPEERQPLGLNPNRELRRKTS